MALPDESKNSASIPPAALSNLSDGQLLDNFKQNPTAVASDLIRQPNQLNRFWTLLERHSSQDQALIKAYDKAQNILGKVPPVPQPQAAPAPTPGAPPTVTAEQLVQPETKEIPRKNIGPENAKPLEDYLNSFKPGLAQYMAAKPSGAATAINIYNRGFLEYLTMYRTGLSHFLLTEGSHEMIFSALGPIGDLLRLGNTKKIQWKMAWMKNPLNANAVYYYLNSLPTQAAFKIALLPVKATFAILAHGGAPLFTKAVYEEKDGRRKDYGQVKQKYFFSPTLRLSQAATTIADGLDKATGIPTDYEGEEKYFEKTSETFKQKLEALKIAKTKDERRSARKDIKDLLNQHDGKFLASIFRPFLRNLSRRWRRTSEDPIIGLFSLIAGTIIEAIIGTVVNLAKTLVIKAVNAIPGVNTLRAQMAEFFNSNRYLNTARMGGATFKSFGQGLFSPTTLTSGYLGYRLGSILFPGNPMAVAWSTGITGGLGAFYNISLKMAANPTSLNWIYRYNELVFKATDINLSVAEQNYWRGQLEKNFLRVDARVANFRPGPFSNTAKWLYEHPYARLPINGFVIGDILSPLMESRYGWNPWVTRLTFAGADWAWQTRGAWGEALANSLKKIFTQPTWTIFGKTFVNHFSLYNPSSFAFRLRGVFGRAFYVGDAYSGALLERPWLNSLKNFWSKAQPYATNIFNPGFWLGGQFLGPVYMSIGLPWGIAHLAGAITGMTGWWGAYHVLGGAAKFKSLSNFSRMGFFGYGVGWGAQLLLNLVGVNAAWTQFLPIVGSFAFPVLSTIPGIAGIVSSIGFFLESFVFGLAHGLGISAFAVAQAMAMWATVTSVALVAGLTVFFAFTVYASFWVPMQQYLHAGPESACFNLQTSATITASGSAKVCSKFTVKEPGLLTEYGYLENSINTIYLDIDDNYPQNSITKANRNAPGENLNLIFDKEYVINPHNSPTFDRTNYAIYNAQCYQNPTTGLCQDLSIDTFLSTYTSYETGPLTIFELQKKFPQFYGLRQISDGYIDLLQQIDTDRNDNNNNNDTEAKLDTSLETIDKIISRFDNIRNLLNSAQNSNDLAAIRGKINEAYAIAETEAKPENNPFVGQYSSFEEFQPSCHFEEATCREIYDIYQSYSGFFQSQAYSLNYLKKSADNPAVDLTELKAEVKIAYQQADFTLQNLKAQKASIKETKNSVNDLYTDNGFWNDWLPILTNLTGVDLSQIEAMLLTAFEDFFTKKFFFTPSNTTYEVCIEGKYVGPTDRPVTFTSSVNIVQPGNLVSFQTNSYGITQFNTDACTAISSVTINP